MLRSTVRDVQSVDVDVSPVAIGAGLIASAVTICSPEPISPTAATLPPAIPTGCPDETAAVCPADACEPGVSVIVGCRNAAGSTLMVLLSADKRSIGASARTSFASSPQ